MTATSLDHFGAIAANTAMRGAIDYLLAHGQTRQQIAAQAGTLCAAIKAGALAALPAALADARAALDCGMGAAAERTFLASMTLAGIAAVREG
jgi:hypothetical protein